MKRLLFLLLLLAAPLLRAQNGGPPFVVPSSGSAAAGGSSTNAGGTFTNLLVANTVFVDATNGNDSTALRGDQSKPYATLSNAFTALQSGDSLVARPGTYPVYPGPVTLGVAVNRAPLRLADKTDINLFMHGANIVNAVSNGATMLGPVFNFTNCARIKQFGGSVTAAGKTNGALVTVFPCYVFDGPMRDMTFDGITISNFADNGFTHLDQGQFIRGWTVMNSWFYKCGATNGGSSDGTAIGFVVPDTLILNNYYDGNFRDIEAFTITGTEPQFASNIKIIGNTSSNAIQAFYVSFHTNSTDVLIQGNTTYHAAGTAGWADPAAIQPLATDGCTINDNNIIGWPTGVRFVSAGGNVKNVRASGNTISSGANAGFQIYPSSGACPKFISITDNTIKSMLYGIDVALDSGFISGNMIVDSGFTGAGDAITLHRFTTIAGSNTVVINNGIFNSGNTLYTDGTITLSSFAHNSFLAGNKLGPGLTAIADSGTGTLGNEYVVHRTGTVSNMIRWTVPAGGQVSWESAGDIMFLNSDFDSPIDALLFGQPAFLDPTPKLERNGSGIRFKDALDDSWANIEAGSVRASAKSYVTQELVAWVFSDRVTNVASVAVNARYTNDFTGLLDGYVIISYNQPSLTFNRTSVLPNAVTYPGRVLEFKDKSGNAGGAASNIWFQTVSSQLIDGWAGITATNGITANNGSIRFKSDGVGWNIAGANP